MSDDEKSDTFESIGSTYSVMPVTLQLLQQELERRERDALDKSLAAGEAAGSGDGWHSSTYRIMQDEMWVLADLQAKFAVYAKNSFVLEIPIQNNIAVQGHQVRLILKGKLKKEYGFSDLWVHLVSEPDSIILGKTLKIRPEFNEEQGGTHVVVSITSPMGRAILQKERGSVISYVGGEEDIYSAKIGSEENAISISPLFNETVNTLSQEG